MSLHNSDVPLLDPYVGFEHIKRYWDKTHNCYAAKILPGEYYLTKHNECVTTVLGSCVSACVRDVKLGIGGMNHFMLPSHRGDAESIISDAARYGNFAMEHLINDILRRGGVKKNLEFKLFGGGKILKAMTDVGKKNIDFVLKYIEEEGYVVTSEDLGDIYPRKIIYFPKTGRVRLKKLKTVHNETIIQREIKYRDKLDTEPVSGDVELF